MRIISKILLAVLLVTIIGSVALGVVVYSNVGQVIETMVGESQGQQVRQVLQNMDQLLYARLQEIKSIVAREEVEQNIASDEQAETILNLSDLLWQTGPWDVITLYDNKGNIVKSTQTVAALEQLTRGL